MLVRPSVVAEGVFGPFVGGGSSGSWVREEDEENGSPPLLGGSNALNETHPGCGRAGSSLDGPANKPSKKRDNTTMDPIFTR
jgi:hypothetical protein